ncbi:MAG: hypothetical protein LBS88_08900 [Tannerellaceae bacterium]|jgi:hypothetical protein|nr:hypothetical protein [Tannerellaceae bacterium]
MEKKDLDLKKEALLITSLHKEIQALKEVAEVNSLKEQLIANILVEQNKAKLTKILALVHEILFPKRPGDEEVNAEQGND